MMKGISFDGVHSYRDLGLILSGCNIPPAQPKTNFVDIPYGNGSIDLTEALGEPTYSDRELEFTFTVLPTVDFEDKKREISNLLNGWRKKIVVDKDPDFYWDGRVYISEYSSVKALHQIVVKAIVKPYKLKHNVTSILAPAGSSVEVHLPRNSRMPTVPLIVAKTDITVEFNSIIYNLSKGNHKILDMQLDYGDNIMIIDSPNYTTRITYQEGDL